jgi:hypothetical protein
VAELNTQEIVSLTINRDNRTQTRCGDQFRVNLPLRRASRIMKLQRRCGLPMLRGKNSSSTTFSLPPRARTATEALDTFAKSCLCIAAFGADEVGVTGLRVVPAPPSWPPEPAADAVPSTCHAATLLGHAAFFLPGRTDLSTPPQTPQCSSRCSAVSRQTVRTVQ